VGGTRPTERTAANMDSEGSTQACTSEQELVSIEVSEGGWDAPNREDCSQHG
jgi:hypothetical protein